MKFKSILTIICLMTFLTLGSTGVKANQSETDNKVIDTRTIIYNLPVWYNDNESAEDRLQRSTIIDNAIKYAVAEFTKKRCNNPENDECLPLWRKPKSELKWLLITQAWWESRLALHVHQDNCNVKSGECDSGRAKSIWQIHAGRAVPYETWVTLGGTDQMSTNAAALAAATILANASKVCPSIKGTIAMYMSGTCYHNQASKREDWFKMMTRKYNK